MLLASAAMALRPVATAPASLAIGASTSEAPRHFWGLWGAAAHLWQWGPFVSHLDLDYPTGYTRHLMDPVNLLPFLPVYWLSGGGAAGATVAWNAVHVFWAVVGALGGWLLVRRLMACDAPTQGPAPAGAPANVEIAALLAAFACGTAPYLLATPYLGRSELLPGVGVPLHLYFLHRGMAPGGRLRDLVAAGLVLAGVALGGWYLAGWLAFIEPPLALWFARRWPGSWTARLGRLTVVAVVALVPVLPALQALLAWPPPILSEEQRVSVHMGICTPPWLLLPFVGNQGLPGTDLPAYPGTVVFLLGAWGALRRRQARPWFALALVLLLVSLGPYLVLSNDAAALQEDPVRLPAWYIEKLVPPLRFIWGWCRLGILVTWPLAVAAAWGLPELLARAREVRVQALVILFAALAVDHGHDRAPAGVNGHAFVAPPPAGLLEGLARLGPGAIVELPFDDFYMVWQLAHGRPVAESLEIEDVRSTSYLVQKTQALVVALRDGDEPPVELRSPEVRRCMSADAARLGAAAYAGVVLHRDRLPGHHLAVTRFLTNALGAPVYDTGDVAIWAAEGTAAPELDCPVAEVRPIIPGMDRLDDKPAGN